MEDKFYLGSFLKEKSEVEDDNTTINPQKPDGLLQINTDYIDQPKKLLEGCRFSELIAELVIPGEAATLFNTMRDIGFNISVTGGKNTLKSRFLTEWLSNEKLIFEGVLLNQACGQDGGLLNSVINSANKGERGVGLCYDLRDPRDFVYDLAADIVRSSGGHMKHTTLKVAKNFDYVFHFVKTLDSDEQKLKSIYEINYNYVHPSEISMTEVMGYDFKEGLWRFNDHMSPEKRDQYMDEHPGAFEKMLDEIKRLSEESPLLHPKTYRPKYF